MRALARALVATALLAMLAMPTAGRAEFGLDDIEVAFTGTESAPPMQAGSHPLEMITSFTVNSIDEGGTYVDGAIRNLDFAIAPGFAGDPRAVPPCTTLDFLTRVNSHFTKCADSSAVGYLTAMLGTMGIEEEIGPIPVFNLEPPPGVAAKLGFWVQEVPQTVEVGVNPEYPNNVIASLANVSQAVEVLGSEFTLWGNPALEIHDEMRGSCLGPNGPTGEACAADIPVKPFITLPRSCEGPLASVVNGESWWSGSYLNPGPPSFFERTVETEPGTRGCSELGFAPRIKTIPTTDRAASPTGLAVDLEVDDEGLTSPTGRAQSDIKKAVVTLPKEVTLNPSVAEGLATCSPEQLDRETVNSEPGDGCPQASKVGSVEVETPILQGEVFRGSLFVATQDDPATSAPGAENPFDSLVAIYMVIRDRDLGVLVKSAGKAVPDPVTGQIKTIFGEPGHEIPQFPLSDVRLRLREGGRSPLISPSTCGTFTTTAEFTPWANPSRPLVTTSSFEITRGVDGGPCPSGPPPFEPGFVAGALNNAAGAFSPFHMRLTRRDGDQDLTRFSTTLPKGMIAKLAGTTRCGEAQIAAARANRGRAELANPSCPPSSRLGTIYGGAGVGSQLTYVPGSFYLAGPLRGAPLSAVAIVPAVAGPFDVGTVVVRQALQVNPRTGEVRVDSAASDSLPTMLAGIPLKVRDVRVEVDRPQFTLNPTSCDPTSMTAELWGSGALSGDPADDAPVFLPQRFQAANCTSLGFKPRLSLNLRGGTKRGQFPALTTVYTPRPGDANLKSLSLRLPRSAFLEQGHFRTICTRVQYAADACPPGAVYGRAKAFTPILDEPLEGPIYLRSSDHDLPDIVFDLHGLVDVEAVARVDSKKGGIRVRIQDVPDAPLSKVAVTMQGGQKGLIVNSRDLCVKPSRAALEIGAQSGKRHRAKPLVKATGCKKKRASRQKSRGKRAKR